MHLVGQRRYGKFHGVHEVADVPVALNKWMDRPNIVQETFANGWPRPSYRDRGTKGAKSDQPKPAHKIAKLSRRKYRCRRPAHRNLSLDLGIQSQPDSRVSR